VLYQLEVHWGFFPGNGSSHLRPLQWLSVGQESTSDSPADKSSCPQSLISEIFTYGFYMRSFDSFIHLAMDLSLGSGNVSFWISRFGPVFSPKIQSKLSLADGQRIKCPKTRLLATIFSIFFFISQNKNYLYNIYVYLKSGAKSKTRTPSVWNS